jgi:hypothetical protein
MILIFRQLILIIIFAGLFSHLIGCSLFSPPSPESLELAEVQIDGNKISPPPTFSVVTELFQGIQGLSIGFQNRIYISDTKGAFHPKKRVYFLDSPYDGKLNSLPINFSIPTGITFRKGHLYVCDIGKNVVLKIDSSNNIIQRWNTETPISLFWIASDLFSLSKGGVIEKLLVDGSVTKIIEKLVNPVSAISDRANNIWIAEEGSKFQMPAISKRSLNGKLISTLNHNWSQPSSLAIDAYGILWTADIGANQVYTLENSEFNKIKIQTKAPILLAPFPPTDLLLLESGPKARLIRISRD